MRSLIGRSISAAGIALALFGCGNVGPDEDLGTDGAPLTAPTSVPSFQVIASGRLTIGDRAQVSGGNIGVAGGAVNGANSITLGLDSRVGVGNGLIGRRIVLNQRAAVGDLFVTQLVPQGGTFTSQSAFSAPPAPPPIGAFTAGTTALTVNSGQTVTLAAANRGQVTVNGTLRLSGGTYQFQNLTLGNDAVLQPTAPSIVRVAGRVSALDRVRILPAAGLNASALRLIVAGANDATGGVSFGNDGQLTGLVVARAAFGAGSRFIGSGAVAATNVTFGSDLRFTFNTGFACNSNAGCDDGNPCTTDTCTDAQCLHVAAANGTACPNDGNACTSDTCANGVCAHPPVTDGSACTLPNASASCTGGSCGIVGCSAGFGDCDIDPANGCEHSVLSDESNCGQCGAACFVNNGVAACANGTCTDNVIQCFDQFEDCDLDGTNGCETDILSDSSHCGQCGATCFINNGIAACADGACTEDVLECFGGFGDCDIDPTNGCENDLLSDESNCGQCGAACFAPNGVAACEDGACTTTIIQCFGGFGDCDGDPLNGCEAPLDTLTNCGDCGVACSFPNGTPSCDTGTCSGTCEPGLSDCDGDSANGCETNLIATCNSCNPPSAGCQYGNDCQELHPDIVFHGSTVGRRITLSGYSNRPSAQIAAYVLGPQQAVNPAVNCDLAAADPAGDPDPTQVNHYNWRLLNLAFSSSTQAFPGRELYAWTMNVTVIPSFEPPSEQQRWPEGGIARIAVQALKFSPSGVPDLNAEGAAFESGCVTALNAPLPFPSLVEECGSASFRTSCNTSTPPDAPLHTNVQILTLVDGSPEKLPTPPETFCSGGSGFSHGHYLNRRVRSLAPNCNASAYEADAAAYYARIGAPASGDHFALWLARAKQPGVAETAVNYYNAGDLGVGREMHCWENPSGATRIACYVTNHLPAVFAPSVQPPPGPDTDPEDAVNNAFEGAGVAATVAMEYVPNTADPVRFFVFDGPNAQGVQPRINRVQLDTDTEPKPVPGLCLACHGGTQNAAGSVPDSNFLPFDNCAFSFSTVHDTTPTNQEEGFRRLNQLVLATNPQQRGGTGIVELINGLYRNGSVNTPGTVQDPEFVPAAWTVNANVQTAYSDIVKPYCRSCHVAREVAILQPLPTPPAPVGFPSPNRMLQPIAFADMCSNHTMPHAEQTLRRFWGGSARAAVARARNTVSLPANPSTNPPLPAVNPGSIVCSP